ncbi:unnamed protein product [Schistosoma turkestanicum]|nr:unnamed protein product [Schistosoma turkestanicum]
MAYLRNGAELAATYRSSLNQMSELRKKVKLFNLNNSYYNQIGLLKHDWLPHSSIMCEALRRLPREQQEARDFRIARASLLYASKHILPQNQWTTIENDVPYLQPYVDVVVKEISDRSNWDNFINPETYSESV